MPIGPAGCEWSDSSPGHVVNLMTTTKVGCATVASLVFLAALAVAITLIAYCCTPSYGGSGTRPSQFRQGVLDRVERIARLDLCAGES